MGFVVYAETGGYDLGLHFGKLMCRGVYCQIFVYWHTTYCFKINVNLIRYYTVSVLDDENKCKRKPRIIPY